MQSSTKLLIVGILMVLGSAGYYYYTTNGVQVSPDSSLTASSFSGTLGGGASVGSNVLALLSQIKGLSIDTNFFQSPSYTSLIDFSVVIPPENVGKSNPFVPLGGYVAPTTPTAPTTPQPRVATTTVSKK